VREVTILSLGNTQDPTLSSAAFHAKAAALELGPRSVETETLGRIVREANQG
jgi:hypothetical protein